MKRVMSLSLAAIMAMSVVGCASDTGKEPDVTTDPVSDSNTTDTTEPVSTEYQSKLPQEYDWGGETLNFFVRGELYSPTNYSHEIYASEYNGDVINDAVYARNIAVQERYNVEITQFEGNDTVEILRAAVLSDDKEYDVYMASANRVATLSLEGYLTDLYTVPHLDLDAPWWDDNGVEYLTLNNHLYFIYGDINIMDNNGVYATLFNKRLFDEYNIEYPYESVKDGTWTLDKFLEIAKLGTRDLDGNGTMDEFDQYGWITAEENFFPMILGSGYTLTKRDAQGNITIDPDLEGIHSVLEKLVEITSDSNTVLYAERFQSKGYSNIWSQVMRQSFREGRGLLYNTGVLSATMLRDMEDEFGIVPNPKASVEQDEYYSWMSFANGSMLAIPVSNDKLEMTGMICEALAAESVNTLTPAYYETTLSGKVARDEDSIAMLDIIFHSVVFDYANLYNLANINTIFYRGGQNGNNTFISDYESIKSALLTRFEELIDKYSENN
ncbi:MAG: extracellular solute-binding protein [Clostridiales bacterium]|nr:extracellular solute-binding protein [Clostridiales bacterium]